MPEALLQRIPSLTVRIDPDNNITVDAGTSTIRCGQHGLAVLQAFSRPISVAAAIKQLGANVHGAQDWMDVTSTILSLQRAGILTDGRPSDAAVAAGSHGFHAPPIHVAMLDDTVRTSAFLAAIEEVVEPGDVVVDVGTGTGALAVAAARSGASHVYAIEAGGAAAWARAVFRANGLENRITLIEGWSTQVHLPELADVLVSETIGDEALGERMLEMILDARKRLLKPGARLVPTGIRVRVVPVTIPVDEVSRRTFTPQGVERWEAAYGIDFSPLVEAASESSVVFTVRPETAKGWAPLAQPAVVADLDLRQIERVSVDAWATVEASASGVVNGVIAYFELQMGDTIQLSPDPLAMDGQSHWRAPVWLLAHPLEVTIGDRFTVRYRYRVAGVQFHDMVSVSPGRGVEGL